MTHRLADLASPLSDHDEPRARAPGKVALTQRFARGSAAPSTPAVQRHVDPAVAAVQRAHLAHDLAAACGFVGGPAESIDASAARAVQRHADAHTGLDDGAVAAHAAQGVSGAGGVLPHLETIQRAFGPAHDLSGVRAHVGGAAADAAHAIGAHAYATGNDVAFAASPDLFLAAHEATHVVQQRQGVSLKGAVGQAGDTYEQHADAVAAAVVRGEDVGAMLGADGGGGGGASVQRAPKGAKGAPAPAPAASPPAADAAGGDAMRMLTDAVAAWEKANISNAFAVLEHANANWKVVVENTGGKPPPITDDGFLRSFYDGVFGNFVTDLPDVAAFGFADAAADATSAAAATAAQKQFSKRIVGEVFREGLHEAGAAASLIGGVAGGAAGLLVASVMATVAEMVIDVVTDKAGRERADKEAAAAAAAARGSAALFANIAASVDACEARSLAIIDEGQAHLAKAAGLDVAGKRAAAQYLVDSAAAVRAKAPPIGDYTIATEVLRQWTRQHVGTWDPTSKTGKSNGKVAAESQWARASQDQVEAPSADGKSNVKLDLWGEDGFDAEIERRATPFGRRVALSEMQLHTCLTNAGISTEGADLFQLQYPDKPVDFGTRLVVVDVARFERFVADNWGDAAVAKAGGRWQVWVVAKERVEYLELARGESVLDWVEVAPIPQGKDWLPAQRFPYFAAR
ncbi:MAG: DUF4157 domain-containing protein [Myxococcales bacterium]|nr:DUF4157 domain-containing protein [Myxococcales bacterium]